MYMRQKSMLSIDGHMPIIGFYGPHECDYTSPKGWKLPNYLTDECYQLIRESGINLISYCENDYAKNPGAVIRSLELAEKYGIGMYVTDSGLASGMDTEAIVKRMQEYSHFKSFRGIKVCDEPGSASYGDQSRRLPDYYDLMQKLNAMNGINGYINLYAFHPNWIGLGNNTIWLDRDHFEVYVDEYCSNCSPKMLSEDYYIFDEHSVETSKAYFENLEIMNLYAQKYDIPYWVHIQVGGQWNDAAKAVETVKYYPTSAEVQWNVNTSLACGAKGIQYFPMIQPYFFAFAPDGEMDFDRNGMIRADGKKGQWYGCVQSINKQIYAVGSYLLQMDLKHMVAKGYYAALNLPKASENYGALKNIILADPDNLYGVIVGCFSYGEQEAYYVVNNDVKYSQSFTIELEKACVIQMISSEIQETIQGTRCEMSLKPGSGVLVILNCNV